MLSTRHHRSQQNEGASGGGGGTEPHPNPFSYRVECSVGNARRVLSTFMSWPDRRQ